jgi:hypothetical protein
MRSTAAWFATEVTEEVELPEHLKEREFSEKGLPPIGRIQNRSIEVIIQ